MIFCKGTTNEEILKSQGPKCLIGVFLRTNLEVYSFYFSKNLYNINYINIVYFKWILFLQKWKCFILSTRYKRVTKYKKILSYPMQYFIWCHSKHGIILNFYLALYNQIFYYRALLFYHEPQSHQHKFQLNLRLKEFINT